MISKVTGIIENIGEKYVVVGVGGLGYKVFTTPDTIAKVTEEKNISFFTYLAVRENSLDLYGFTTTDELSFFELLLDVSGIGPKSALGILAVASTQALTQAIGTGDTNYLTKVGGIGRKTAEKIVLELRDKLKGNVNHKDSSGTLRAESDIIEALKSLGYTQNEARDALKEVSNEITGTNARIKEALKILGK